MKKICIIGDSHSGCMRVAESKNPRKNIDLTFFGASGFWTKYLNYNEEYNSFEVKNNEKLEKQLIFTSGGDKSIFLSKYDEFYFVRGRYRYFLELFKNHNIYENKIESINYPKHIISDFFLDVIIKEFNKNEASYSFLLKF